MKMKLRTGFAEFSRPSSSFVEGEELKGIEANVLIIRQV